MDQIVHVYNESNHDGGRYEVIPSRNDSFKIWESLNMKSTDLPCTPVMRTILRMSSTQSS